jgi:hypothetical protein
MERTAKIEFNNDVELTLHDVNRKMQLKPKSDVG